MAAEARASTAFGAAPPALAIPAILVAHGLLWTLLPALLHANLQRDQIEGFAWGLEWQWGYAKHPPLWAWALEATTLLTGRPSALAAYALGAGCGVAALALVWRLTRAVANPWGGLVAVLALEGVLYLNFRTVDFNANVVLLPAWAAAGLFFRQALVRDRLGDWIGLGLALALGLYGKYATLILVAVLGLFLLADARGRARLARPGPWIGVLVALAALAPHLAWLARHGLAPIAYALARTESPGPGAGAGAGVLAHLTEPALFLAKQAPEILGFAVLALILTRAAGPRDMTLVDPPADPGARGLAALDRAILRTLALGPIALTAILCAGMGRPFVAAWALPMFCFLGPWLVIETGSVSRAGLARFLKAAPALAALLVASFTLYYGFLPDWRHKPSKTQFPGEALAQAVIAGWTARFPGAPLTYVAGPIYVAGNVAFHGARAVPPVRPHVVIDGDPGVSPWIDVKDLARRGAVLVWLDEGGSEAGTKVRDALLARFPGAEPQEPLRLAFARSRDLPPLGLGWALVPPGAEAPGPDAP